MESNSQNIGDINDVVNIDPLLIEIKREKEALVSMFLTNASITELAAQYRLIDELSARINRHRSKDQ